MFVRLFLSLLLAPPLTFFFKNCAEIFLQLDKQTLVWNWFEFEHFEICQVFLQHVFVDFCVSFKKTKADPMGGRRLDEINFNNVELENVVQI
jgi:hypothetical protein